MKHHCETNMKLRVFVFYYCLELLVSVESSKFLKKLKNSKKSERCVVGDSDCEDAEEVYNPNSAPNDPQLLLRSRSVADTHEFLGNPYRPDVYSQQTNTSAKKKISTLQKSIRAITSGKLFHKNSRSKTASQPATNIDPDVMYIPLRRSKSIVSDYATRDIRPISTQNELTPITSITGEIGEKTTRKKQIQTTRYELGICENFEANKARRSKGDRYENHENVELSKPRKSTHGRYENHENEEPNKPRRSTHGRYENDKSNKPRQSSHGRYENHEMVELSKPRKSTHDRNENHGDGEPIKNRHSSYDGVREKRTEISPPRNTRELPPNADRNKNGIRGSRDIEDRIEGKKPMQRDKGEIRESASTKKSQHPARDDDRGPAVKEDQNEHMDSNNKGKNVVKPSSNEKHRASTSDKNHHGPTAINSTEYSVAFSNCGSLAFFDTGGIINTKSKKRLEESRTYMPATSKGETSGKIFFKYTLRHVLMIMRHGPRTPMEHLEIFTKHDDLESLYDGVPLGGELTHKGYESMMNLGKRLRVLYHSNFLDPHCEEEPRMDIQATATTMRRCKSSAEALVEGLYDPHGPLISTYPENPIDPGNLPECPRIEYEVKMIFDQEDPALDGNLIHFFREYVDRPHRSDIHEYSLWHVVDNVLCEAGAGYKHPNWMDYDRVKAWKYEKYSMNTASEMALKLKVGPMFEHIIEDFSTRAASNLQCSKMQIYGSHDDSVLALLHGLNVQMDPGQIFDTDFGCGLIFELYSYSDNPNGKKSHHVRVLYNKNTNLELQALVLNGCGTEICPLRTFIRALRKNIPHDWEKDCEIPK